MCIRDRLNNYQKTDSKIIDLLYQPVLSAGTQFPDLFYACLLYTSTYDAVVILDDTGGKYVNFKLEFPKRKDGVHGKK